MREYADASARGGSGMREYNSYSAQNSYSPSATPGTKADGAYVPQGAGSGGIQSFLPPPVPGARPGQEFLGEKGGEKPPGTEAAAPYMGPGLNRSSMAPFDAGFGMDRTAGLGSWSELIAGGVVDRPYIEQEAERRKQEIDRQMDNQLAQIESQCQEQTASIKQQADYHTQMAEKQIEGHKRQHLAQVARQAELQGYAIVQKAEMEKGRLGQEAYRALAQQSEREKAAVLHEAMRKAEDVWRHSQRALMEQAQKAKADIDVQAHRRATDIEKEAREAISRVYLSPNGALGVGGGPLDGPSVTFSSPERIIS